MSEQNHRRALLSVSDKTGVVDFAKQLQAMNFHLVSTGGTASLLANSGVELQEVSDYTGFPEIMDGRVKTLHPKIHGGILARGECDDATLAELAIERFDLVVVNLYPFEQVVQRADATLSEIIENIDIGGPTLVRAAAKNFQHLAVVVDQADYAWVSEKLQTTEGLSLSERKQLAAKAFQRIAEYDIAIARYFSEQEVAKSDASVLPQHVYASWQKVADCRYGENPHQQAAVYAESSANEIGVANAEQLQGKPLSYNNLVDADAAWACVRSFPTQIAACVIVKHANPCGVALADDISQAYERAFATDPTSAFGGIIAVNQDLDVGLAQKIIERQFVEVIIAPRVTESASKVLASKPNVRVLVCPLSDMSPSLMIKRISGGVLIQENDIYQLSRDELRVVSQRQPTKQEVDDCLFAWQVVKAVKSNAIVYVKNAQTIGIGAGQMSRVHSAQIGLIKAEEAGLLQTDLVLASDAFFPFRDSIDMAAKAGVTTIIQPGGSIRDQEVIAAADEANIAMIFTGIRHFYH